MEEKIVPPGASLRSAKCADAKTRSPRFRRKQLVRHLKTGGVYRIVFTPAICRIETMNEPAYAYRMISFCKDGHPTDISDAPMWVRPQSEMEDGRFEPLPLPTSEASRP